MPSLREVNLQKAREMRLERLALSRKFGASLGVEGARRYQTQKLQQEEAVKSAIKNTLLNQREEAARAKEVAIAEDSLRKGEGIRQAQEYSASLAAKATVEGSAWHAEKWLERARFEVAKQSLSLQEKDKHVSAAMALEYRRRAKEIEANRSAAAISKSKTTAPFTSLAVPLEDTQPQSVSKIPLTQQTSVVEVTANFESRRQQELVERQRKLEEDKKKSIERSQKVLREKKAEEELNRIEKENEMMLKKSMLDHAMRTIRPMASHDFQAQDARRSTQLSHQAHKAFEEMFLSGPWAMQTIKRFHGADEEVGDVAVGDDEVEGFAVFKSTSIGHLLSGTPSVSLPVDHLYAKVVLPMEAEADAVNDEEEPSPNHAAPVPMAGGEPSELPSVATINSTGRTQDVHPTTSQNTTLNASLPPMPIPAHLQVDGRSANDAKERPREAPETNAYLEDRNRQFLQQLAVLQRRLESAKTLTAPLHAKSIHHREDDDESETSQDASSSSEEDRTPPRRQQPPRDKGDTDLSYGVDVSPMSSPEREVRRDRHVDPSVPNPTNTIGAQENASMGREKVRLAMTTDQLRNAIQKMRLSNKHLDTDSDATTISSRA